MILKTSPNTRRSSALIAAVLVLASFGHVSSSAAQAQREAPGSPSRPAPAVPGDAPVGVAPGDPSAAKSSPKRRGPLIPDDPGKRAKLQATLYAFLATAENEAAAKVIAEAIDRVRARGRSDTVAVLLDRAHKAFQGQAPDVALRFLDTVVKIAPDDPEGFHRRAFVYHHLSEYERALGDLRRVIALDPNHEKALEGLGQVLKDLGRKKAALAVFQRLLAVNPHASSARSAVEELAREVDGQGT